MAGVPVTSAYTTCLTRLIELTHSVTKFRLLSHAPKVKTIEGILLRSSGAQFVNKNFRRKTSCRVNNRAKKVVFIGQRTKSAQSLPENHYFEMNQNGLFFLPCVYCHYAFAHRCGT